MPILQTRPPLPFDAHDEANGNARDRAFRLGASGRGEMSQPAHAGGLSLIQGFL